MEALLSCFHPELGQILPSKLIPLIAVSYWVLKTACQQDVTWREAGLESLPIAVNFSPNQFQQPSLISMVEEILTQTGLEPGLLEIEITLTKSLNLRVVAEGVETHPQLELLRSIDCEEVQGFWFSHPLRAEDATKLLLENYDGSSFINQGEF